MKQTSNLHFGIEEFKSIPICDILYGVALDTTDFLPKIESNNKYVLVAIDHYSKWCEGFRDHPSIYYTSMAIM